MSIGPLVVGVAVDADVEELASVAAATFPLACPPTSAPENVAAFVAANLSPQMFSSYLSDHQRAVLTARLGDRIIGYAMVVHGVGADPDVGSAVRLRPAAELSKIYVLPASHGSGAAAALIEAAVQWALDARARCVWLGVNQRNARAHRFYAKHGFRITGTKMFQLGADFENDFVMVRPL